MDYREEEIGKSNMIIYTTEDGLSKIETIFDGDTVWLSKAQMAELFQRDCSISVGYRVNAVVPSFKFKSEIY